MKVIIQSLARLWGGGEKWLITLAEGLKARGHDVVISCPSGPVCDRAIARGLRVTRLRPRGVDPLSGLSFTAWVIKEKPDALLIGTWHSLLWSSLAGRIARVPKIVWRLGISRRPPSTGPRGYAIRHWLDAVITNAPEIRNLWIETLPFFPQDRVHVVLNAVTPAVTPRDVARKRLTNELRVPAETLLIGGAGIVTKRKNFALLLRAFARVRPTNSHLVIVGDGPHRTELERLAVELDVRDMVSFMSARENAAEIIAGLDIFVLSSRNEGMANVMLEAMANGVPVIAADISGVKTAIGATNERPAAGWIFSSDNESDLASVMSDAIADIRNGSPVASAMTREALWRVDNWFTVENMVDQCEQILFG
jgi:glycosyltransferase involved in cell wall biosynthesis